jgi:hypothetical protein
MPQSREASLGQMRAAQHSLREAYLASAMLGVTSHLKLRQCLQILQLVLLRFCYYSLAQTWAVDISAGKLPERRAASILHVPRACDTGHAVRTSRTSPSSGKSFIFKVTCTCALCARLH